MEYSRLITKQGVGAPTIPVSLSHDNGDWLPNDLYEGELYVDMSVDPVLYTRKGGSVFKVSADVLLEAGVESYTVRWSNSANAWVASNFLLNTGSAVGIGGNPARTLDVYGPARIRTIINSVAEKILGVNAQGDVVDATTMVTPSNPSTTSAVQMGTSISTSSSAFNVISGMQLIPGAAFAGKYKIFFNSAVTNTVQNAQVEFDVIVNGIPVPGSAVLIAPNQNGVSNMFQNISLIAEGTVTGSQVIAIRWRALSGTANISSPRNMQIIRM